MESNEKLEKSLRDEKEKFELLENKTKDLNELLDAKANESDSIRSKLEEEIESLRYPKNIYNIIIFWFNVNLVSDVLYFSICVDRYD